MYILLSLEKRKLSHRDRPLWERILQGPSDDIMKIFLMDMHEEEVSNDVSYIYGQSVYSVDLFFYITSPNSPSIVDVNLCSEWLIVTQSFPSALS